MATYSYPKKKPEEWKGLLFILMGSIQLAMPLHDGVKIAIALLGYLAGCFIVYQSWKLRKRTDKEWEFILDAEGIEAKQKGEPWHIYWEDISAMRLPFPSTNPVIEFSKNNGEILFMPLAKLSNKFQLVGELQNYCREVPGVEALQKIATPGKWFRFIFLSVLIGVLFIIGLFATVPFFVYFFFLRK